MNHNKPEFLTSSARVLKELCKAKDRWGLYVSFMDGDPAEITKAAPYLAGQARLLFNGSGWIFVETEEEMLHLYRQTVGDDGPTTENPYKGSTKVYALTCSPEGVLLTENT